MMRSVWGLVAVAAFAAVPAAGAPEPPSETMLFTVLRDGSPIGTTTIQVQRDGSMLSASSTTRIKVKLGFLTVYRFDQSETERWAAGRFQTLSARTDDNGTVSTVRAQAATGGVQVEADGKSSEIARPIIPNSLWNPALVSQTEALNLQDGRIVPLHVVDRGVERIELNGRPTTAHHYLVQGIYAQNVWYDQNYRLVKMEMRGGDGSTIEYRLE